ncbi:chemotaxis protein CheD [Carboxydocella sporoproducens DSM 16521]|uniref:Probable chemoreceptor glutamine deamidase CheD n=2 Tax=Carboxydocella TaxID=178898 RepID=A0A1T4QJJ1_9FIRM|nr:MULTISPECIES: chemotaxis protein CheD [Carboxydocella]AVX19255.1 chemotaxis protein CheD [Carboxydocella thermautotrophica]SKA03885.1 chemotaxis protein CheD [Carboxydocella sporoproducens DSM 16521]
MNETKIGVGLGEMHWSRTPNTALVCYGLGSCVGIAAYDPVKKLGAMAHVVLPDSSIMRPGDSVYKYADTCVPALLAELERLGAERQRLQIKIAGGAQVLAVAGAARMDIGNKNVQAVKEAVRKSGLRISAEDTGGNHGRTLSLFIDSGKVTVKVVGKPEVEI